MADISKLQEVDPTKQINVKSAFAGGPSAGVLAG